MQPKQLTSLKNPDIKKVVRLRERKFRDRTRLTIVEGLREILAAVEAKVDIKELYVCRELFDNRGEGALVKRISSNTPVMEITKEAFAKIAYGDRQEGLLAVCQPKHLTLNELLVDENSLWVIVENVEKPGNLGAILRTCDAGGVSGVVVCDHATDLYNPNIIRASLGIVFSIPVVPTSNQNALQFLQKNKINIVAAMPNAKLVYTQANFKGSCAIVLGSEEKGLSDFWKKNSSMQVNIPMLGHADSLNVSSTAAILIYEAIRQRSN